MTFKRKTREVRRYLAYLAVKSMYGTARVIPYPVLRSSLSLLLGSLAPLSIGRRAHENLTLAYDDALSPEQRRKIVRAIAKNLGNIAAEVLSMQRKGGAFFSPRIDMGDLPDKVARELERGKGLIHVTGHIGNWELGGHATARLFPQHFRTVVGRKMQNQRFDSMMTEHRLRSGIETVDRSESPRRLLRRLQQNQSIAVVPDQDIVDLPGIFIEFLGRRAYTPIGPAWLSLHSGAPIMTTFLIRSGRGFRMHTGEIIRPDTAAATRGPIERDAEIRRLTIAWSRQVEAIIREFPEQWMWFHRRWRTTPERLARRRPAREAARASTVAAASGSLEHVTNGGGGPR